MQFTLEKFTGPLDLLLSLIQEKELDISEIALAHVTEQYLEYIDQVEEIKPEELADFLVVASRLLLIKARALLPQLMPEEEGQNDLTEQLRLYRMYVDVSKKIHDLWNDPRAAYGRIEPFKLPEEPQAPANLSALSMDNVMAKLIRKLAPAKPLPKTYIDKTVSLKERIEHFRTFLKNHKSFSFSEMISDPRNKTETIITFLALLELVKQKTVQLNQNTLFSEISVERV